MSGPPNAAANDWQLSLDCVRERGAYILTTAAWSDCSFLVGEPPEAVKAHRLFLAMTSPVFEAMLYGPMAEGNKPIPVPDVPPNIFRSLLEYIYTDNVDTSSFESTCGLYYAAKKYMLNELAKRCVLSLRIGLSTGQACQAYELAMFYEEEHLAETCLMKFRTDTQKLLHESSFEEASVQTVEKIFSLDRLTIDSELVLLEAAERYLGARGKKKGDVVERLTKRARIEDDNFVNSGSCDFEYHDDSTDEDYEVYTGVRKAVKHIRFLSMTPQQFASRVAGTPLLEPEEALSILISLVSKQAQLPDGFSLETTGRSGDPQLTSALPKSDNQPSGEGRAESVCQFTVHNFKARKRRILSDVFYVNSVPFRLELTPDEGSLPKRLNVEVVYRGENASDGFSFKANVTVTVVNQTGNIAHSLMLRFEHIYCRHRDRAGTRPLTWDELCDPHRGLLRSNTVVFEVYMSADPPDHPPPSRQTI